MLGYWDALGSQRFPGNAICSCLPGVVLELDGHGSWLVRLGLTLGLLHTLHASLTLYFTRAPAISYSVRRRNRG